LGPTPGRVVTGANRGLRLEGRMDSLVADRIAPTFYIRAMDARLKRLLFRSHHMGSNENDILFGGFAERYLATLDPGQLDRYEALLAEADTDLFNWVTGKEPVPRHLDHDVMAMVKAFVDKEAAPI
jgi:antitoxin CptB